MKKTMISFLITVVILFSYFFAVYFLENKKDGEAYKKEKETLYIIKNEIITEFKRKYPDTELSFMIKNLDSGNYVIHNNKKMRSASLIKLFVAGTVFEKIENGDYTLDREKENDLFLMLAESNNEAVNKFIDDFGGENELRRITEKNLINQYIKNNRYNDTELQHKMYDEAPPGKRMGYKNLTSVNDVTVFLEKLYKKELFSEPYNTKLMEILKKQKRQTKIPAIIKEKYPDVVVANKTGELFEVDNDAALIVGENFALSFVIMTDNIPLKENGEMDIELKKDVWKTISELAFNLVEKYY